MSIPFVSWDNTVVNRFISTLPMDSGLIIGILLFIFLFQIIVFWFCWRHNKPETNCKHCIDAKSNSRSFDRCLKNVIKNSCQIYTGCSPYQKVPPTTNQACKPANDINSKSDGQKDNTKKHVQILTQRKQS